MLSLLNPKMTTEEDAELLSLFSPDELKKIFAVAESVENTKAAKAEKAFQKLLGCLNTKFGASKLPEVLTKANDSTLRKVASLAFSEKLKRETFTASDLAVEDGYRSTIAVPLSKLNKLMDYLEEDKEFSIGKRGTGIQVKVIEVENGVMKPEKRKCGIPNYDVNFEVTYKSCDGESVSFTAEVQFPLEGAEELFAQSRLAYGRQREVLDRMHIWTDLAKKMPERRDEFLQHVDNTEPLVAGFVNERTTTHNKIREMFDLDSFKASRETLLEQRFEEEFAQLEREEAKANDNHEPVGREAGLVSKGREPALAQR